VPEEKLILRRQEVSPFMTNCYLLVCTATREAAIVDPGGDPELIEMMIGEAGNPKISMIVNTHAHVDHASAVHDMQQTHGAPFHLHPDDGFLLEHIENTARGYGMEGVVRPRLDHELADGQKIALGDLTLEIIHTPGHSPGGVCIAVEGQLICGDTLFAGSIGRTDLPGGSYEVLLTSIHTRLLGALPDDTVIHPGHGPASSLGRERVSNPFLVG
jgi:glyoxylase-like metal-dependent hydrolase (beta-lactamase superfamily II)